MLVPEIAPANATWDDTSRMALQIRGPAMKPVSALLALLLGAILMGGACGSDNDNLDEENRDPRGGEIPVSVDAEPDSGPPPLEVDFTAVPAFPAEDLDVRYGWDFGDGNTSTDQNPSHTYEEPGDYRVELLMTVGGDVRNLTRKTLTIRVGASIDDWTRAVNAACAQSSADSDAVVAANDGNPNNPQGLAALSGVLNAETDAVGDLSYPSEFADEIEAWLAAREFFADAFLAAAKDGMISADEDGQLQQLSMQLQTLSSALDLESCIGR